MLQDWRQRFSFCPSVILRDLEKLTQWYKLTTQNRSGTNRQMLMRNGLTLSMTMFYQVSDDAINQKSGNGSHAT